MYFVCLSQLKTPIDRDNVYLVHRGEAVNMRPRRSRVVRDDIALFASADRQVSEPRTMAPFLLASTQPKG